MAESTPGPARRAALVVYFVAVAAMVVRIAWLDDWSAASWCLFFGLVATARPDRVRAPTHRSLALGASLFAVLCAAVAYLPDLWFRIAYQLNHAEHYLWNANRAMASLPLNDGSFLWTHRVSGVSRVMRWVYLTGFDMVVWIPVVRSLVALDPTKTARYALAAHVIQFPMILPFYTAIRVDEVWSVLGHPDRLERGWSNEMRLDLGANCFPSMHTSVAFAILLLALRERSAAFRGCMMVYSTAIIVSTVYMEVHWLLDVAGGLALGMGAVRISDSLVTRVKTTTLTRERAFAPEAAPPSAAA
jgi:membrane-associated phospholipid phosphatase